METIGFNKRIHWICVESTMRKCPPQRNVILGGGGSRNQNEGIRSVKGASMNVYTVRILHRAWYDSDSQNPLPADGGEWTSSSVPADKIGLRRNELPRKPQNMSGERERELTVYPVVQLPGLVCRFVGTSRVRSCQGIDSVLPSIVRTSGKPQVFAGTVKGSSS